MSSLKICPSCSAQYPDTERFCPKDGAALHPQPGTRTDLVGSIIAQRYHVVKLLGTGGMGRVYLAEHVKMGRRSAIKVLHPSMARDAEAISRFNREAANASRIDHPNVAAIYDFGETPDGLLYLAMQYIEGQTLTQIMRAQGALPPLRASDIVRQAAEGLHAAHAMGIVHRDLKPDNVMICTDADGLDGVKVVDFGIAKSTKEHAQGVTRSGVVMGTPEFMSPEQLAGEELDGRCDLYSLALITFNMLTGVAPFSGTSISALVAQRFQERPRTLAEMRPDVAWPNEVQAVLDKALERDRELRYSSIREFAHALHAAVAMMPSGAHGRPNTRVLDVPSPGRRRRAMWAIGAGVALAVAAAITLGSRSLVRGTRARSALAEGITAIRSGQTERAKARLIAASNLSPNDARPHVFLSRLAREANDLATANDEAVRAVRLAPEDGPALRELATTLYATQNFNGARAFYTRAVAADPADRVSQGYLGCSLIQLGRVEEGLRWLQRAGSGTWS
ncbi:MAG TPA: protein kinase, partial [Gemmatimonadaceae bacterium]|nr:protein kinase [Gemmatimonadaceae bacterium]